MANHEDSIMTPARNESRPARRRAASPKRRTDPLRRHVSPLLNARNAHGTLEEAASTIPPKLRGVQPAGLPYSPWQLLEHIRLCQRDILDYCIDPKHREMSWPKDYWPESPAPPSELAWDESIASIRKDRKTLERLARDPEIDLLADLPHAKGVTFLHELLLVADHNAYHVGQIVVIGRLLQQRGWSKLSR
jgi:hypothetical protein